MAVPCCRTVTTLDALHFDWLCGLTRFEIAIANPVRADLELNAEELNAVATILGNPIDQILAHI